MVNATKADSTLSSMNGGFICSDPSGLCMGVRGSGIDSSKSGVCTQILRLASQLDNSNDVAATPSTCNDVPIVSIETTSSTILLKERYGHTIALRVPTKKTMD